MYGNLAVKEEISHGMWPMTSVIIISRNSRISWPGNSVYLYQSKRVSLCLCDGTEAMLGKLLV